MFVRIATALLFKKSKYWLMPLFVVMFSSFLLFEQFAAFRSVRGEMEVFCKSGDLWVMGEKLGIDELLKVRRLQDVAAASFIEDSYGNIQMSIKTAQRANLVSLKGKIEKATGRKVFTRTEFSKALFQVHMKGNRAISLFSIAVLSGLVLALGIFTITFYSFFKRELVHYSVFKAVGATPLFLTGLLVFQAIVLSLIGWGTAFLLYILLQQVSGLFLALSWGIIGLTLAPLLVISIGTGICVSFKVKGIE